MEQLVDVCLAVSDAHDPDLLGQMGAKGTHRPVALEPLDALLLLDRIELPCVTAG